MSIGDVFGGFGDAIGDITGATKVANAMTILGIGIIALAVVLVIR